MAGHGGGAWKVAYADFVTAMMAFFLVMWIVAQNKPVKEAIAQYFRDPWGHSTLPGDAKSLAPLNGEGASPIEGHARRSTKMAKLGIHKTEGEGRLGSTNQRIVLDGDKSATVGTQVQFDDESAHLDHAAKRVLDQIAPTLQGKINKIELRGHATAKPLPPNSEYKSAWDLSYARSIAAMQYLTEKGIDPRRFRLSQGGAHDPNRYATKVEGTSRHARVEIYVLNEVITAPIDSIE
jgi:chemotaxis protein MotB